MAYIVVCDLCLENKVLLGRFKESTRLYSGKFEKRQWFLDVSTDILSWKNFINKTDKTNKKTKVNVLCYAESIDNHA